MRTKKKSRRRKTLTKNILILIIILISILLTKQTTSTTLHIGTNNIALEKGLLGHWTLDEINYNSNTDRVTDKTPYENHGTNYGATFTTDRFGKTNGAINLDNVTGANFIKPTDIGLNLNNETISFWMKSDFIREEAGGGSFDNWIVQWGNYYQQNSGGFGLQSGTLRYYIKGSTSSGWSNSGSIGTVANSIYDEYNWIHYVLIFEGNNKIKFYMNGIELQTPTISDAFTGYDHNSLNFGKNMKAALKDIRIYNRILSTDEIKLLYDRGRY